MTTNNSQIDRIDIARIAKEIDGGDYGSVECRDGVMTVTVESRNGMFTEDLYFDDAAVIVDEARKLRDSKDAQALAENYFYAKGCPDYEVVFEEAEDFVELLNNLADYIANAIATLEKLDSLEARMDARPLIPRTIAEMEEIRDLALELKKIAEPRKSYNSESYYLYSMADGEYTYQTTQIQLSKLVETVAAVLDNDAYTPVWWLDGNGKWNVKIIATDSLYTESTLKSLEAIAAIDPSATTTHPMDWRSTADKPADERAVDFAGWINFYHPSAEAAVRCPGTVAHILNTVCETEKKAS